MCSWGEFLCPLLRPEGRRVEFGMMLVQEKPVGVCTLRPRVDREARVAVLQTAMRVGGQVPFALVVVWSFETGEACSGPYNCEVKKQCLYGCKN